MENRNHLALISWRATSAPVGHFSVLRALPTPAVPAIGPFVFLDHFGPARATGDTLPAHPHAGIEVMTYLFEGANEHRDSMGHRGTVSAGGAQWMRAGRGILHAETTLPALGPTVHGLQLWARLPIAEQECEPQYRAIAAADVPQWAGTGTASTVRLRLLAGQLSGHQGPITLALPTLLLHVTAPPGTELHVELPSPDLEHGLYGIGGVAHVVANTPRDGDGDGVDNLTLARGDTALLRSGTRHLVIRNRDGQEPADILLLGGQTAPRPLIFGGPFVLDSQAAVRAAGQRFSQGEMGTLDGVPF